MNRKSFLARCLGVPIAAAVAALAASQSQRKHGKTFFVNEGAAPGGDGSLKHPFATPDAAMQEVVYGAGDVIINWRWRLRH